MRNGRSYRAAIRSGLLAGATVALFIASPAAAYQQVQYDIPAGDAARAVQTLAVQSNVQVVAPSADLAGVSTQPVKGAYEPLEALLAPLDLKNELPLPFCQRAAEPIPLHTGPFPPATPSRRASACAASFQRPTGA